MSLVRWIYILVMMINFTFNQESEGPFFSNREIKMKPIKQWFLDGGTIEACVNEYWGTRQSYDFNDCYKHKVIKTYDDFKDFLLG